MPMTTGGSNSWPWSCSDTEKPLKTLGLTFATPLMSASEATAFSFSISLTTSVKHLFWSTALPAGCRCLQGVHDDKHFSSQLKPEGAPGAHL